MAKKNKKTKSPETKKNLVSDTIVFIILLLMLFIVPIMVRVTQIDVTSPFIVWDGIKYDQFSYQKFFWLVLGAILVLATLIYKILGEKYKIEINYTSLPLAILIILLLISGLASDYKSISLLGKYNRHEGTLTYISYLILFFAASTIRYSNKKVRWLVYALSPVVIINFILSIVSFYGYNPLNSSLVRYFLLPSGLSGKFKPGSTFSTTLENLNYLSGVSAVLTVIFLTTTLLISQKKEKILSFILFVASFAMMLTSVSSSGFFSFFVMLPLVFIMVIKNSNRKKAFIKLTVVALTCIFIFTIFNFHDNLVGNETIGAYNSFAQQKWAEEDGNFNLPALGKSAGNGRLYIWQKTIGLIKAKPLFGYGMDTIYYHFPQDDPGKASGMGDPDIYIDKPHNMYLNIAYGAGIIALLTFIVLLARHFHASVNLLRKTLDNDRLIISAALFAGWNTFLVQALFNDSTIGAGVIFWIIFGASVSIIREELKEQ